MNIMKNQKLLNPKEFIYKYKKDVQKQQEKNYQKHKQIYKKLKNIQLN